jgi:peptide subunit release factor 1 (eRF1)
VVQQLQSEISTASNIKDKSTGKAVAKALKALSAAISKLTKLPPTGIVCYAGTGI